MNRRGFLARLFAAPIVALALLKAPVVNHEVAFNGDDTLVFSLEDVQRRYIEPAAKAMMDRHDAALMEHIYRSIR